MLKKTVTYIDFFGEEHTEDFYFHMTKLELSEMAVTEGDLFTKLQNINSDSAAQKGVEIIRMFRELITKAYGERSEDGKRFIKEEQLQKEFSQTAAFDHILSALVTHEDDPTEFMKAILPPDLAKQAQEHMDQQSGKPQDFKKKAI